MNVFDVGGLVSFVAIVMSLIVGIGIYILLNSMFEITHFGIGAVVSFFFGCVIAGAFIVNLIAGIIGGFLSIVWGLIKIVAGIAIVASIGMFIYNKISGNKQGE